MPIDTPAAGAADEQPSLADQAKGHGRDWAVWWQGSGERGDHIMEVRQGGSGYAREIAFIGPDYHDQAGTLVDAHNEQVRRLREVIGRQAAAKSLLQAELGRIRAVIPASLSYEVPDTAEAVAVTFREYVRVAAEATALRKAATASPALGALADLQGSIADIIWQDYGQALRGEPDHADHCAGLICTLIASSSAASAPPVDGGDQEPDDLLWLRYQVFALCEDTEDRTAAAIAGGKLELHDAGFHRGRKYEAKGIRRAIAEVVRCRLADRAALARHATPDDEVAFIGQGLREALVEITEAADEMIAFVPGHWHDDHTIRLTDAAADANKVLKAAAQDDLYNDTRLLFADLKAELGTTDMASTFRAALARAKEAVAEHRTATPQGAGETAGGDLDVSEGVCGLAIRKYREARRDFGATSEEASHARSCLWDLEELIRRFAVIATAAPEQAGSRGWEEALDALALILPMAKGYAAAHPVGANQSKVDHAEAVLAARPHSDAEGPS